MLAKGADGGSGSGIQGRCGSDDPRESAVSIFRLKMPLDFLE